LRVDPGRLQGSDVEHDRQGARGRQVDRQTRSGWHRQHRGSRARQVQGHPGRGPMRVVAGVLLLLALTGSRALAQAVFLDKPVQAGELILFPDINNPRAFYYLPNKIVLGKGKEGTPQFSFLRWVENEKSTGEETRSEGEGGGIVHTVVQLEVTPDQIAEAERELQRKVKSAGSGDQATILGPIIYKKGTMALISSAADDKGGFTK